MSPSSLPTAHLMDAGIGQWLPLTPENPALAGWSMNDILINTRGAADLAGATKMDRPEWIDTFPESLTAIATLTNNTRRGTAGFPGIDEPNPRVANAYGHVIQWSYANDWTENTFHAEDRSGARISLSS